MEETEIKDSSRDIRNNEEIYKRYVDQEIKERNEVTKENCSDRRAAKKVIINRNSAQTRYRFA